MNEKKRRFAKDGNKLGRKSKRPTTTRTFRFPIEKREEIINRIKELIKKYDSDEK